MSVLLRRVRPSDEHLLLEWVNAPDSLANKLHTTRPVSPQEHSRWFAARLADAGTSMWIIETDGGVPVGQIRIQKRRDLGEIDIYVVPAARRSNVASAALQLACRELKAADGAAMTLAARVKTGNEASRRLFVRLGFALADQEPDHALYLLSLR